MYYAGLFCPFIVSNRYLLFWVLYERLTIARPAKKFPAFTELKLYYVVHKSRPLDPIVEPNKSSPRYPNAPKEDLFLLL